MPGGISPNTIFITVAVVGAVISIISAICIFVAGTAISHVGSDEHVLFKDLALVTVRVSSSSKFHHS